ncbi:MAG: hypothetical protein IKH78_00305 [Ruminococcus sp.]|nr:hypothetical protein [Ruminococcus sp.]
MSMNVESAELRFIRTAAVICAEGLESRLRAGHYVFFTDSGRTVIFNITASAVKELCRDRGINDYEFTAFDGEDIPEELLGYARKAAEFYRSRQKVCGYSEEDVLHFITESVDEQINPKYRYYARVTVTGCEKQFEAALGEEFPFMKPESGSVETIYQRWGCECGSGWFGLICDLCVEIAEAYSRAEREPDIIVSQVKQKFARLRFYYSFEGVPPGLVIDFLGSGTLRLDPADEGVPKDVKRLRAEIKSIVRRYEEKSGTVCEYCGVEGSLRKLPGNYYRTLCDECFRRTLERSR